MSTSDDRHRRAVNDDQSEDYFDFESKDSYRHSPAPTQASVSEMEGSLSGSVMSPLSPDRLSDSDEPPNLPSDDTFTAGRSSRQCIQTFPHPIDFRGSSGPASARQQPGIPVRSMTSSLGSTANGGGTLPHDEAPQERARHPRRTISPLLFHAPATGANICRHVALQRSGVSGRGRQHESIAFNQEAASIESGSSGRGRLRGDWKVDGEAEVALLQSSNVEGQETHLHGDLDVNRWE